ncbi:MAG: cytidylate kinase-like family protein [Planctomycetes bacterium]|nr:cytidylate kinase-like family protein [Planctomycetota bacterium]
MRAIVHSEASDFVVSEPKPSRCTVTVSRDYGAGADELAQELAKALNVRCWDREILDAIVQAAGVSPHEVEHLDQHVCGWLDDWIYALSNGRHADRGMYLTHLTRVLHGIANHGGVIVGRGAYLVLAQRRVFRLRVTGSSEACARRIAAKTGADYFDALKEVQDRNAERAEYLRTYYQREADVMSDWDLIVNTDRIDTSCAIESIVAAMKGAGYEVPAEAQKPHAAAAGA